MKAPMFERLMTRFSSHLSKCLVDNFETKFGAECSTGKLNNCQHKFRTFKEIRYVFDLTR